jgi:hypothetical protein
MPKPRTARGQGCFDDALGKTWYLATTGLSNWYLTPRRVMLSHSGSGVALTVLAWNVWVPTTGSEGRATDIFTSPFTGDLNVAFDHTPNILV